MNGLLRLAAYGALLVLVLVGGWLVGARTDLAGTPPAPDHSAAGGTQKGNDMDTTSTPPGPLPDGLQVSADGYTLALARTSIPSGRHRIEFQVTGPDDAPVTQYERSHDKDLHLIAVRRDFAGFQHVHPVLDPSTGTWTVPLALSPGTWRVFADFVPAGSDSMTLGADLLVAGDPGATSLPAPVRSAEVDGYTVSASGDLAPGEHSMLTFEVTRDGAPVTDLEPYLGAYGHLVVLREGDLAYLHAHPGGEPDDGVTVPGPTVEFGVQVPSPGRYHLYLDFQVDGVVRTAELTLDAPAAPTPTGSGTAVGPTGHSHG